VNEKLRPHQQEPFEALKGILARFGSGVDESGTGTGKTYVAAAVAGDSRLPTLVVHPKVAHSTWERAANHFGERFSQVGYELLRAGNTPFGAWSGGAARREEYFVCECCQRVVNLDKWEPCYVHPKGIHCLVTKSKPHDYGQFVFHPGVKQIVFDEVHRCGGRDSLNADILIAAKRQGIRVLGLSATLAASPLQMRSLGYLLDLHGLDKDVILRVGAGPLSASRIRPNFYRWASHYGCRRDPRFRGWKWMLGESAQREVMLEIRNQIIPARGVRVRCEDIPGFPACDIQAELYNIEHPEEIDRLYAEVQEALGLLDARAAEDKAPDSPITRILRGRQRIELLKTPIAEELGRDYLEKGFSVVFFVNFRQTIDELSKRFPDAPIVDGSPESVKQRDASVAKFQRNDCPALIVNNQAGGVCLSMQDLDGFHPRMGLVMPSFSATDMIQVCGRLPRDGGKSTAHYRFIFADSTIEKGMHRAVRAKQHNIEALNDADLSGESLMFTRKGIRYSEIV
jgi:hypothetical protein